MASGLYRTFKSNYVPYHPDGNGRDRYIAYNNAGFFKDFINSPNNSNSTRTGCFFGTKIVTHTKTSSVKTPNFHYHADGNGRDKYILVDGGGLFSQSKPLICYKLTDFLRKEEDNLTKFRKIKSYLSKDEIKYNKMLKEKERNVIKRLYQNERKKFMRRQKINFKSFFSVDELNNDSRDNSLKDKSKSLFLSRYKITNNSMEKEYNNKILTHRNRIDRIKFINDPLNVSGSNYKKIKIKPRILIDAKINNKIGEFSKEFLHQEKQEQEEISQRNNNTDLFTDIGKLKKYKFKKPINARKMQCFRIKNALSSDN